MARTVSALCLVLLACASGNPAPAPPQPRAATPTAPTASAAATSSRTLAADERLTTGGGASLLASLGWSVEEAAGATRLVSPEKDLTATFVVVETADVDEALRRAWAVVRPGALPSSKQRLARPAKDGWEGTVDVAYETPASSHLVSFASARLFRGKQHVAIVEGTEASLDRRAAQLATAVQSYRPAGLEEEQLAGRPARKLDAKRVDELLAFAEKARVAAKIPGASIVLVQDGEVVVAKGLGVRGSEKKAPVTPKTLFMIGSTTKSLTTLMMAKLVDEGRFAWDTKVTKVAPDFALGDAKATETIEMRHTVCACTGLPRKDLTFFFEYAKATPESHLKSLRGMKPTTALGETFQYSNVLVAAGGYLAAHAAAPDVALGAAFDATFRSRVLEPLGMKASTLDPKVVATREHAAPHGIDRSLEPKPFPVSMEDGVVPVRPAGALWSNAEDMARYLQVELGKGVVAGKRVVSEENLLARRKPSVRITERMAYGLGLFVEDEHGVPLVGHGGNNLGFTSDMFFLPEHGVGMVVLTNAGSANAYRKALRRKLVELVFDARAEAETQLAASLAASLAAFRAATEQELGGVAAEPSPEIVAEVAGAWTNEELGRVTISGATIDVGEWTSRFSTKVEKDGTKKIVLVDPPFLGVELEARKDELEIRFAQERYVFTRAR